MLWIQSPYERFAEELDIMILAGPIQIGIFCDCVICELKFTTIGLQVLSV